MRPPTERISFVMDWQPRCCVRVPRSVRSANCCVIGKHRRTASKICPSLTQKRVTVHRLRHTMAMDLLQGGVDRSVIALWLGHESVETTQIYLAACEFSRTIDHLSR